MSDKPAMKAWRFIPPEAIAINRRILVAGGPEIPAFDPLKTDDRIIMSSIYYTSSLKIHGVWMQEMQNQQLFLGYRCHACNEVFLVPDSVTGHSDLSEAMRHGCTDDVTGVYK